MDIGILIAVLVYEVVIFLGVGLWMAKREASIIGVLRQKRNQDIEG